MDQCIHPMLYLTISDLIFDLMNICAYFAIIQAAARAVRLRPHAVRRTEHLASLTQILAYFCLFI
jgi:hypothetical protein